MGKHKRSAVGALDHLVERSCEVLAVVCPPPDNTAAETQRLDLAARRHGLRLASDDELYAEIEAGSLAGVDLVLSFLFPRRILAPLIQLPRLGCLNFHPAPLPDLRGLGAINVAIMEDRPEHGVSVHFVDETYDTGDLVEVERFPIDRERETAWSLDLESQRRLLDLFRRTIDHALAGDELPRAPQGEGRYVTREEFESLRVVRPGDPPEDTARRIRAYWYPPFEGAVLELDGRRYTLLDGALLEEVARRLRETGEVP
jgi:methionyl-tRNA formyltransferase